MELTGINNLGVNYDIKENKHINAQNTPSFQGKKADSKAPVDPEYYLAAQGIKNKRQYTIIEDKDGKIEKISTPIKLKSGEMYTMVLEDFDVSLYLTDKNGKFSKKALDEYTNLYASILDSLVEKNDKAQVFYKEQAMNAKNGGASYKDSREALISGLFDMAFSNGSATENEQAEETVRNMPDGEFKAGLANMLLKLTMKQRLNLGNEATFVTQDVFDLSRTNDGYDLTRIDEKRAISNSVRETEKDNGVDDLIYKLISFAKKDNGSVDIDFIKDALSLMNNGTGMQTSPEKAAGALKKYYAKVKEEEKPAVLELAKTIDNKLFTFETDTEDFEDLMNLAFDKNGNFDEKRAGDLIKIASPALQYLVNNTERNTFYLDLTTVKSVICDYFKSSTDKNGNYSPYASPEKFFKNKISQMHIIDATSNKYSN